MGILEENKLTAVLFADTTVHFIAMAAAVMLWTQYVISYLGEQNIFRTILDCVGKFFLIFEIIVITVNFFYPVMFWFDEDVQRSIQAGINAHLSKPVEPELLYETLRKLIRTKR